PTNNQQQPQESRDQWITCQDCAQIIRGIYSVSIQHNNSLIRPILEILLVFHGPSVHVHAIPSMDRPWNSTSMPTSGLDIARCVRASGLSSHSFRQESVYVPILGSIRRCSYLQWHHR